MIKPFLMLLLGSFSGNEVMLPSASYSIEAGVQRKWLRLGLEGSYNASETSRNSLFMRSGANSLVSITPMITVIPQIRSKLKPYLGVGYGYNMADREIKTTASVGWKEWETVDSGMGTVFKGGVEYRGGKHWYVVAGVRQLVFRTILTEHRQQYPKHEDSLDYQRVKDIDLSGLTGQLGVKWVF